MTFGEEEKESSSSPPHVPSHKQARASLFTNVYDGSRAAKAFSRVRCVLQGLDLKTYIFFLTIVPIFILGVYLHGR
ncbi:hypothetical protein Bca4012_016592 [Brassica carinata]|uniref:Uncharacterized protein n=1 Tax=Brassica carinata TaxID=52824 RepID=A0A8X8BCQ6_BRACI|nr:hypothetical protein Bca52824_004969 [Brassica carinata]